MIHRITRRHVAAMLAAAAPASSSAQLIGEPPGRIPPVGEIINAAEMEAMARRKLDSLTFAQIAGGDRAAFDRITFRPRLMINSMDLDLTQDLYGARMFAPILVGPLARQQRYHPDAEAAMAKGAAAAKAAMVVSARSSVPFAKIAEAAGAGATLWFQAFPDTDAARVAEAVKSGCKAVILTLGGWPTLEKLRQTVGANTPLLVKGIMSPAEATAAIARGAQGIVVSNYRGGTPAEANALVQPIEVLPAIADAAAGKVPILIDGSFRRGSDILKALALGARAVLLGRPMLWSLAAYGAPGVQHLLELLQTELARDMAMCGKPNLKKIDRATVRLHSR